jgi:hypothetical protein
MAGKLLLSLTFLFTITPLQSARALEDGAFVFRGTVESKGTSLDSETVLYVRVADFWVPVVLRDSTRLRSASGNALTVDEIAPGASVEVRADWTYAGFVAESVTSSPSDEVTAVGIIENLDRERVVVNGIAFRLDPRSDEAAELSIGQSVAIRGSLSSGGFLVANQVDSHQKVRLYGKIETITAPDTLTVAGTTVKVGDKTKIIGSGEGRLVFGDLKVGQLVTVMGRSSGGTVNADLIRLSDANSRVEIVGSVTAFNATSLTVLSRGTSFNIKIDSKTETLGVLSIGVSVNVSALLQTDGTLLATRIVVQSKKKEKDDDGDKGNEVEGTIESIGTDSFKVKGITIKVDSKTVFESDDKTIAFKDLKVGDHVEVKGTKQSDGSILASKVEVEKEDDHEKSKDTEIEGIIEQLGTNSLTVRGVKITVDSKTEIRRGNQTLKLADLKLGNRVHVKGLKQADNSVLATQIVLQQDK